jgi:hypothetical protein
MVIFLFENIPSGNPGRGGEQCNRSQSEETGG